MTDNLILTKEALLKEIGAIIRDKSVLEVFNKVPRQNFVPVEQYDLSYKNTPL